MEAVETPQSSSFVGHEHVHHGEDEWLGSHCFRYHTYLVSESPDLSDSIALAYEDSIHVVS